MAIPNPLWLADAELALTEHIGHFFRDDVLAYGRAREEWSQSLTGISGANDALLPRRVRLGPNSVGWHEEDRRAWIAGRPPVSGQDPAGAVGNL